MTVMEVFINEPLLEWQAPPSKETKDDVCDWIPQEKLHVAELKLRGHSSTCIQKQYKTNRHTFEHLL